MKIGAGGFLGLLALVFIGLKLGGVGVVATWSWWWVLSPIWIPLALVLGIWAIVALLGVVIIGLVAAAAWAHSA